MEWASKAHFYAAAAEGLLLEHDAKLQPPPAAAWVNSITHAAIVRMYVDWEKPAKAASWRKAKSGERGPEPGNAGATGR